MQQRALPSGPTADLHAVGGIADGSPVAGSNGGQCRIRPYTVKELAANLDVSPSTLYRDIDAGRLKALRIGRNRGTLRIPVDAAADYLTEVESRAATRPHDSVDTEAGAA